MLPLSTVTDVRPRDGGGFTVRVRRTGGVARRDVTAEQVIFAAGAHGTQRLLHRLRDTGLPAISPRLGELAGRPVTGHFLGGCAIGAVIDAYHRLYGYPGLHVIDGSAVPANLGVNPALTITALAERAVGMWPNKGSPDPRPVLGSAYRNVPFIPPVHPVVPSAAPGALRWWKCRPGMMPGGVGYGNAG